MRKFIIIIVSAFLLTGCQGKESNLEPENAKDAAISVASKIDFTIQQNDLVFHDYGTGVKLSSDSSLSIPGLEFDLQGATATICAIELRQHKVIPLCDYLPKQDITFNPKAEGVYTIIAVTSDGRTIDLTPKAVIGINATNGTEEEKSDFLLLK